MFEMSSFIEIELLNMIKEELLTLFKNWMKLIDWTELCWNGNRDEERIHYGTWRNLWWFLMIVKLKVKEINHQKYLNLIECVVYLIFLFKFVKLKMEWNNSINQSISSTISLSFPLDNEIKSTEHFHFIFSENEE